MKTHTPGPWALSAGRTITTENGEFYISYGVDRHANPLWRGSFAELDRNAQLIKTAPEMLTALELALATLERLDARAKAPSARGTIDVIKATLAEAVKS